MEKGVAGFAFRVRVKKHKTVLQGSSRLWRIAVLFLDFEPICSRRRVARCGDVVRRRVTPLGSVQM